MNKKKTNVKIRTFHGCTYTQRPHIVQNFGCQPYTSGSSKHPELKRLYFILILSKIVFGHF